MLDAFIQLAAVTLGHLDQRRLDTLAAPRPHRPRACRGTRAEGTKWDEERGALLGAARAALEQLGLRVEPAAWEDCQACSEIFELEDDPELERERRRQRDEQAYEGYDPLLTDDLVESLTGRGELDGERAVEILTAARQARDPGPHSTYDASWALPLLPAQQWLYADLPLELRAEIIVGLLRQGADDEPLRQAACEVFGHPDLYNTLRTFDEALLEGALEKVRGDDEIERVAASAREAILARAGGGAHGGLSVADGSGREGGLSVAQGAPGALSLDED